MQQHIESLRDHCGLLDAKNAFGKDFPQVFLDNVFYADQYKRMEFGRGKLAEMTFYAKQSQNLLLIGEVIDQIFYKLECLIQTNQYDALAFVPWSIERKNQLLKYLKQSLLPLGLPLVPIVKYAPSGIPIPQKTLKTREQRIQNAQNTIFVDDSKVGNYQKILLIDDFVGSGSTLNETAQKLKQLKIPRVDGFAFVGNLNLTYEVIREI